MKKDFSRLKKKKKVYNLHYILKDENQTIKKIQQTVLLQLKETCKSEPFRVHLYLVHGPQD